MDLVMFTKHLKRDGDLSLDAAGDRLVELGFDGADLTVRPGGYVEPGELPEGLPPALDTLEDKGLKVPMLTTAIKTAGEYADAVFEIADRRGIDYLKLGYWRYDGIGTLATGRQSMHNDLGDIAELSASHDVTPAVHIHSGDYLSAEAGILADILEPFSTDEIGAYIDPGHMFLEGTKGGWKQGLDILRDEIVMVAVKDFTWADSDGSWRAESVGLRDGMVDWPTVFDFLDDIEFDGPISLHSEYGHFTFDELIDQTAADLAYVQELLTET